MSMVYGTVIVFSG